MKTTGKTFSTELNQLGHGKTFSAAPIPSDNHSDRILKKRKLAENWMLVEEDTIRQRTEKQVGVWKQRWRRSNTQHRF